jgi:3-oxoacyl-[acyl-carrier-protein] synthase II
MNQMKKNRVVITGMGAMCGLGHNLNDVWSNAIAGKSGISKIESIDNEALTVKIAGEVKDFQLPNELLSDREQPRYDKFIHYAVQTCNEALKDAGLLEDFQGYDPYKVGCILGVGMGGLPGIQNTTKTWLDRGPRRVSPFFIPSIIPNMASGLLSILYGIKGVNYTIASACASASHAISAAAYDIESGRQDVVITGGSESVVIDITLWGFTNMKALSRRNDEPEKASRPFDTGRDGFVMGEGAGLLVFENYEKAKARGARIYAEVVGHGATSDAHHITAPHPEGDGACASMKMALDSAGISPEQVGYINAHGTSTPLGDIAETKAIKKTFGKHAFDLKVSSTKSMTGHLLGAAGGIESIMTAKALFEGIIPPTINLENQDPECDLNYVPNKSIKADLEYGLNNSFGFGGTNSTLIVKKYLGE